MSLSPHFQVGSSLGQAYALQRIAAGASLEELSEIGARARDGAQKQINELKTSDPAAYKLVMDELNKDRRWQNYMLTSSTGTPASAVATAAAAGPPAAAASTAASAATARPPAAAASAVAAENTAKKCHRAGCKEIAESSIKCHPKGSHTYCSKACQISNKKDHKKECSALK